MTGCCHQDVTVIKQVPLLAYLRNLPCLSSYILLYKKVHQNDTKSKEGRDFKGLLGLIISSSISQWHSQCNITVECCNQLFRAGASLMRLLTNMSSKMHRSLNSKWYTTWLKNIRKFPDQLSMTYHT